MNKVLFFEDHYKHYETIHNSLSEDFKCFPEIDGSPKKCTALKRLYWRYISDNSAENEKALVDYIKLVNPDVFVVDIALFREDLGKIDLTGGLLRKNLLSKYFPTTPAVILTQYLDHEIRLFKQEGDVHIYKFEFSGIYPGKKLLELLKETIDSLILKYDDKQPK